MKPCTSCGLLRMNTMPPMHKLPSDTKAAGLMVLSAMSFAAMQILIAKSAARIPLFEQLFFRNLLAAGVALISVRKYSQNPFGKRENRKLLILRSLMGYLGMVCLFYATARAAQGDVAVINKMSPFIVTLLSVIFLRERIAPYQMAALVLAFSGAVLVSRPTFDSELLPMLVALLSAFFSGIAYTAVGALKGREMPCVVVFFFSLFSTLVTAVFMIADFVMPTVQEFLMLLGIGTSALCGQMTLTHSYALANASEVSIFNYSGILFSMLFGYLFLGQKVGLSSAAGAALVTSAGILALTGAKWRLPKILKRQNKQNEK